MRSGGFNYLSGIASTLGEKKLMLTLNDLRDAKYVNLETFRKNGQGVKTPIWQTMEGDTMYMWTPANSWKVKRIRNNPKVRVCESTANGTPKSDWIEAQAQISDDPEIQQKMARRMTAKYGLSYHFFRLISKLWRTEYIVLILNPA